MLFTSLLGTWAKERITDKSNEITSKISKGKAKYWKVKCLVIEHTFLLCWPNYSIISMSITSNPALCWELKT